MWWIMATDLFPYSLSPHFTHADRCRAFGFQLRGEGYQHAGSSGDRQYEYAIAAHVRLDDRRGFHRESHGSGCICRDARRINLHPGTDIGRKVDR